MVYRRKETDVPVLQREGGSEENVQQSVSLYSAIVVVFLRLSDCWMRDIFVHLD